MDFLCNHFAQKSYCSLRMCSHLFAVCLPFLPFCVSVIFYFSNVFLLSEACVYVCDSCVLHVCHRQPDVTDYLIQYKTERSSLHFDSFRKKKCFFGENWHICCVPAGVHNAAHTYIFPFTTIIIMNISYSYFVSLLNFIRFLAH